MIRIRNTDIINKRIKQSKLDNKEINLDILHDVKTEIEYKKLKEEYNKITDEFKILNEQAIYYKTKNINYENQINDHIDKIEQIEKELNKLKTPRTIIYGDKKKSTLKYNTPRKIEIPQ
jgi:chromosome segregation ATPase